MNDEIDEEDERRRQIRREEVKSCQMLNTLLSLREETVYAGRCPVCRVSSPEGRPGKGIDIDSIEHEQGCFIGKMTMESIRRLAKRKDVWLMPYDKYLTPTSGSEGRVPTAWATTHNDDDASTSFESVRDR